MRAYLVNFKITKITFTDEKLIKGNFQHLVTGKHVYCNNSAFLLVEAKKQFAAVEEATIDLHTFWKSPIFKTECEKKIQKLNREFKRALALQLVGNYCEETYDAGIALL